MTQIQNAQEGSERAGRTCPECGSARWVQQAVTYRDDQPTRTAERGCRACGASWPVSWTDAPQASNT